MSFIKDGRINLQVFEYRQPGQTEPSDPDFEFMKGSEPARFVQVGLTHEILGPDEDGGPVLICACANGGMAKRIKAALELLGKF